MVRAQALTAPTASERSCRQCGAAMVEDQEWCLECGAARTRLRPPPDWRVPVAIVAAVVLLVVIAILIALVALSIQSNS